MDKSFVKQWLLSHVGVHYLWGGNNPLEGMDCSGFVIEFLNSVYRRTSDMTANSLRRAFKNDEIDSPRLGTLAFFGVPTTVTHVAVMLDEHFMVEAGGGGSTTLTEKDAERQGAYVRVRPINSRRDLVGFAHPLYTWE